MAASPTTAPSPLDVFSHGKLPGWARYRQELDGEDVGSIDDAIAREFQRHFLFLGLKGGLLGASGAAILFAVLSFFIGRSIATPEGDQVSALFGRFAIGPTGYLGALVIALLIGIMTAITSRLTVYRHLASIE